MLHALFIKTNTMFNINSFNKTNVRLMRMNPSYIQIFAVPLYDVTKPLT